MASLGKIELLLLAFLVGGCASKKNHPLAYDSGVLGPDTATYPDLAPADTTSVSDGASVKLTVPESLTTFTSDVRTASDAALGGSGPQVCSAAVPAIRVASSSDMDAAILSYVSAIVGVPPTAIAVTPQACGDAGHATCANIFQNDVAHFGGANAVTTYPLAQQIEATATNVQVAIYSPTDTQSMGFTAIVVMSGIQNGWLMTIATFGDRTICH
jgi:hypothetical protein